MAKTITRKIWSIKPRFLKPAESLTRKNGSFFLVNLDNRIFSDMDKQETKWMFLDRDGVLVEDTGYVHKIEGMKIMPGVIDGLRKIQSLGYKFIVLTNQAGIARGYYSMRDAENFNQTLILKLKEGGIRIEKVYLCPHHPDFTGPCRCRKPETGLVEAAAREFNIVPQKSIFIGDKDSDTLLGKNCGGKTFFLKTEKYKQNIESDFTVIDLKEVAEIMEGLEKTREPRDNKTT
ncbi:HAD family hydrolase [bacterium]|nr:MAG: HAD family hydrolase [bacterium]